MKFYKKSVILPFLLWCPGAVGFFLRQRLLPLYFQGCGRKVIFGRSLKIRNRRFIRIGSRCVIADGVELDAANCHDPERQGIELDYGAFIGVGTRIIANGGRVRIGKGASIGSSCLVDGAHDVAVREKALLAAYCRIGDGIDLSADKGTGESIVGAGCWLGARVVVRQGAVVGDGCVVGAHAEVCRILPPYTIAIGRPAQVVRHRRKTEAG